MLSFHSQDDKKFEQTFLYQSMKKRLQELEDTILSSEEIMTYDKSQIKELSARKSELEQENEHLRQQNNQLAFQVEHLQTDCEILTKESESLKATIAKYTLEGGKLQSLLSKATEELNVQMEAKGRLEQLLKEKNNECEDLLAELIRTKVAVGDLNGELDEAKKQLRSIKGTGRVGGGSTGSGASRSSGETSRSAATSQSANGSRNQKMTSNDAVNARPPAAPNHSSVRGNAGPPPSSSGNPNQYSSHSTPSYNPYNSNNQFSGGVGPNAAYNPYPPQSSSASSTDYYYQNNSHSTPFSTPSHQQPPQRDFRESGHQSDYNYNSGGGAGNPSRSVPQQSQSNGRSGSSLMRGFGGW